MVSELSGDWGDTAIKGRAQRLHVGELILVGPQLQVAVWSPRASIKGHDGRSPGQSRSESATTSPWTFGRVKSGALSPTFRAFVSDAGFHLVLRGAHQHLANLRRYLWEASPFWNSAICCLSSLFNLDFLLAHRAAPLRKHDSVRFRRIEREAPGGRQLEVFQRPRHGRPETPGLHIHSGNAVVRQFGACGP